jgi:hypothetical protein
MELCSLLWTREFLVPLLSLKEERIVKELVERITDVYQVSESRPGAPVGCRHFRGKKDD